MKNGYYQFAFNKDSLLLLKGFNDSLFGLKEFFIDSNYLFKKQHNLKLIWLYKDFKGKVLDEKTKNPG